MVASVLVGLLWPAGAGAVFPGANGLIAFDAPDSGSIIQVWTANADGSGYTQLTTDPSVAAAVPVFSPNGKRIAFVTGNGHIAVMDADGKNIVDLTPSDAPGGVEDDSPTWSPDGTRIAFSRIDYGSATPEFDIWVMNAGDGSGQVNLTAGAGIDSTQPAWSPAGGEIAFVRGNPTQIWTMGTDGSNPTQLTSVEFDASEPSWSPGGQRLVFSHNVGGSDSDLWLIDADGQNQRQLTNSSQLEEESSTWSPDGSEIITRAEMRPGSPGDLYKVDPATGSETIIPFTNGADHPDWQAVTGHTLTVSENGSGSGTTTSSPPGISCPGTCSHVFAASGTVTLSAAPAAGSLFSGWSGGGCSGTGSCTVTTNSDQTVQATFTAKRTLTVTASGSGTVWSSPGTVNCGSAGGPCSDAFTDGTSVTLRAVPTGTAIFTGWSGGGCSGIGDCRLVMNADTRVTASFATLPAAPQGTRVVGPLSWSARALAGGGTAAGVWWLSDVQCPSASLCVAVGSDLYQPYAGAPSPPSTDSALILTSSNPKGGSWTQLSNNGVDIDIQGNVLNALSCPSTSLCVAVDNAGNVLTSTTPANRLGPWTMANVDGRNWIDAISCATTSSCVAVDLNGNVLISTNPTGGSAAWHVTNIDGTHALLGVSCPSLSLCVATDDSGRVLTASGNSFTSTPATAEPWIPAQVDGANRILSVSCVQGTCVATDSAGNVITSANGGSSWNVANVDGGGSITDVSCPTAGLCVAGDRGGSILASTNPTGGAGQWKRGQVTDATLGVSCVSVVNHNSGGNYQCVAVDGSNGVVVGARPVLSVARYGTGSGTVTGSAAAISCGQYCAHAVNAGSAVTLTATPDAGSVLSGWSVSSCSTASTCTVTVNADTTVAAIFSEAPVSSGSTVTVTGGATTLSSTYSCHTAKPCSGTVSFTAAIAGSARVRRPRNVVVAKGTFRVPGHGRRTTRVRLTRLGLTLARAHRLHRLTETITTHARGHRALAARRSVLVRYGRSSKHG